MDRNTWVSQQYFIIHEDFSIWLRRPIVWTGTVEELQISNEASPKIGKASDWLEATHLLTPWQLQRNRFWKRAAWITIIYNWNINLQLKNGKILILEDCVVHKKDVFAESSLAHAASWRPSFSVYPLAVSRAGNSSLLQFFQSSGPDYRSAELYGDSRLSGRFRD